MIGSGAVSLPIELFTEFWTVECCPHSHWCCFHEHNRSVVEAIYVTALLPTTPDLLHSKQTAPPNSLQMAPPDADRSNSTRSDRGRGGGRWGKGNDRGRGGRKDKKRDMGRAEWRYSPLAHTLSLSLTNQVATAQINELETMISKMNKLRRSARPKMERHHSQYTPHSSQRRRSQQKNGGPRRKLRF